MKKMKLLRVIKSVCLMVVLCMVNNACAMELIPSQDSTAKKFVRELPLMTLARAHYRHNQCNAKVKAAIEKKVVKKNDECFSMAFNVATKISVDGHLGIARKLFNNTPLVIDEFLKTPIKELSEVLELYQWTQDVYDGKEARHFMGSISSNSLSIENYIKREFFERGCLFQHANGVKKIDACLANLQPNGFNAGSYYHADRETLKALCVFDAIIKSIGKDIDVSNVSFGTSSSDIIYRHYDTYKVANFLNKIKNRDGVLAVYLCCAVPIITSWLSRYIELNYCKKMLTEDAIKWNERAKGFNELLKQLKKQDQKTWSQVQSIGLIGSAAKYMDCLCCSWSDLLKMNLPFFGGGFSGFIGEEIYHCYKYKRFTFDFGNFFIWTVGVGFALVGSSYLRSDNFPVGFLGVFSGVTAGFLGLACVKTLRDMRSVRWSRVKVEDISELLKKCDDELLVIE